MDIGKLIAIKRKELGLNTIEFAEKLGVSHTTVIRWESGHIATIKTSMVKKIADVLRISPLELLDSPTDEEQQLIYQYRSLSAANKTVVINLINNLLEGQK